MSKDDLRKAVPILAAELGERGSPLNFSLTIPGVFYDVIARVIPGYYLYLLTLVIVDRSPWTMPVRDREGIGGLFDALGFVTVCYIIGWLLRGIVTLTSRIAKTRAAGRSVKEDEYQFVKLKNEPVGYRLLKTRAEATMLDAFIAATLIVATADLASTIHDSTVRAFFGIAGGLLALRIAAYTTVVVCWMIAARHAWSRYAETIHLNFRFIAGKFVPPTD